MPGDPPDHLDRERRGPDQLELARTGLSRRRSISQGPVLDAGVGEKRAAELAPPERRPQFPLALAVGWWPLIGWRRREVLGKQAE